MSTQDPSSSSEYYYDDDESTISLPSIAFVLILGFILYRYVIAPRLSSSSSASSAAGTAGGSTTAAAGLRFTHAQVEQVSHVFPQLNRRDIMWDLQRNRGNVARTIERVMSSGRLDAAPASFQPIIPTTTSSPTSQNTASSSSSLGSASAYSNLGPDLITRYNLQNRLGVVVDEKGKGKEKEVVEEQQDGGSEQQQQQQQKQQQQQTSGWSSSKDERQAMLQRRRDEMILAARRKMQERDARLAGSL